MSQALKKAPAPAGFALPAKQARSRATRDALIEAGLRLVEQKDFDTLSIAEIAMAAGCSVGSFYFRFADKDAFFRALVADMLAGRTVPLEVLREVPAERIVAQVVAMSVAWYRQRRGLLRAAIRLSMADASIWQPLKQRGHDVADLLVQRLARPGAKSARLERRIRFALQVLYGTLNNSILIAPGPLQLGDKDFESELLQVFSRIIAA